MNAQERLDYLLAEDWVPTNALVTIGTIKAALPEESYGLVLATFAVAKIPASNSIADIAKAAETESSFIAMSGDGLNLSSPERQAVIDALATAGSWPDAVRDAVKALGGVWRPRWQSEGYATQPTLQSVQAEINRDATAAWYEARDAVVREGLHNLTITTQQQVGDVFGGE